MEALSYASKAETLRMLDSILAHYPSQTHAGGIDAFVDVEMDIGEIDLAVVEFQNRVLTWIYTFHERSFEKASEALEELETNGNLQELREEAIESVKQYVTAMKEGDFSDMVQIVFEENNKATDDSIVVMSTFHGHYFKPLAKLYAEKRGTIHPWPQYAHSTY
jgi:hypothetical protein